MLNLDALAAQCRQYNADFAADEPLSRHTTFRVGGNCRAFLTVKDSGSAERILQYLRQNAVPFRLIGRGSNLLVPDTGYPGVVLVLVPVVLIYLLLQRRFIEGVERSGIVG